MVTELLNVDKFINDNGWKEVKVSNYFVPNTSENHPDGLVSNEIFGSPGTIERKINWGYIELNDVFMNPQAFYVLFRLKMNIMNDLRNGLGNYYVNSNGELTKLKDGETVPETAKFKKLGSGIQWLYEAWPYIDWTPPPKCTSSARDNRNFLKYNTIDELFIRRYPVMPAFYRDVDFRNQRRNEINVNFYSKMIHLARMIKNTDDLYLNVYDDMPKISMSHIKMQELINEIYQYFTDRVPGANGFIHENVIGKNTDYGARMVISAPSFNTNHYKDGEVGFFRSSAPLAMVANIYSPFIIYGINQLLDTYVSGGVSIPIYDEKLKCFVEKELDPAYKDEFTVDKIKKRLTLYRRSKFSRVEPVTLRAADKSRIPLYFLIRDTKLSFPDISVFDVDNNMVTKQELKHKEINWCELLYIVSEDNLKNKSIYNARYPVVDFNGKYPSFMNIIPCTTYEKRSFAGNVYKRFPVLNCKTPEEIEHSFIDSMRLFSSYLEGVYGDYDGDQMSIQPIYSIEATEDCKKHMLSLLNVVGINGKITRPVPTVPAHGLYGLTYKTKKEG